MAARVVHCRREPYDVLIDRTTKWGNPYKIGVSIRGHRNNREDVIALYKTFVLSNPDMVAAVKRELRGKVLGCWCAPKACHGDLLAAIANAEDV